MLTRTPFPFLPVLCDFWRATPWQSAARDTSLSLCPSALLDRHEKKTERLNLSSDFQHLVAMRFSGFSDTSIVLAKFKIWSPIFDFVRRISKIFLSFT